MHDFAILTNRKRTKIALIHSVVFLLIAMRGAASASVVPPIWTSTPVPRPTVVLIGIYLIVATVLILLARISRCTREKLYFVFCATSASIGLLRYVFGDPTLHAGLYLRVLLLTAAVITCTVILRLHSHKALEASQS
jgi:hypothetical protein